MMFIRKMKKRKLCIIASEITGLIVSIRIIAFACYIQSEKLNMAILSLSSVIFAGILLAVDIPKSTGHGRLMEPPNRSSIWRFPEFAHLNPPENYNDNELFCGGRAVQHDQNGGRCGECGDNFADKRPRANEGGGIYAKGIIVRKYIQGQIIDVDVELTSSHKGYFEYRLCPWNKFDQPEEQSCFDKYVLQLADGTGTRYIVPTFERGHYKTKVVLPSSVTCDQCVLQWTYVAGNTWGDCGNGTSAMGCGPQEHFRGCADVAIH